MTNAYMPWCTDLGNTMQLQHVGTPILLVNCQWVLGFFMGTH